MLRSSTSDSVKQMSLAGPWRSHNSADLTVVGSEFQMRGARSDWNVNWLIHLPLLLQPKVYVVKIKL